MTAKAKFLPLPWEDAIERMFNARSSPVYMPASLVIALEMVARGETSGGVIEYESFAQCFRAVMKQVVPSKTDKAWQPFFHLTGRSQIWALRLGAASASFEGLPDREVRSAKQLAERADRAVFVPELAETVNDPAVRTVRAWPTRPLMELFLFARTETAAFA